MADPYVRYTYWLTQAERKAAVAYLGRRGIRVEFARSVMCTALEDVAQATVIAPPVWDRLCARQGSWYRQSRRAGQDLLVVPAPVEPWASRLNTVIRLSEYLPERLATHEEMRLLVSSEIYRRRRPQQWERITSEERERTRRWMAGMGILVDLEEVFLAQRANHANFLDPILYVMENGRKVPYSIAPTTHLCSCCLELYNVIGERFPRKFVAPCLGASTFADLPKDRYFEVITPRASHSGHGTH